MGCLLREFRRPLSLALLFVVVDAVAGLLGPVLVKTGIDSGVQRGSAVVLFAAAGLFLVVTLADIADGMAETAALAAEGAAPAVLRVTCHRADVACADAVAALPAAVRAAGHTGVDEDHIRLDWKPAPAGSAAPDTSRWAVLGDGPDLIPGLERHADVPAVVEAPDVLIVPCTATTTGPRAAAVRATTAAALATLQEAADSLPDTRIVLVTVRAVDTGDAAVDLTGAGIWGLGRVAQAENPGRVGLSEKP